LIGRKFSEETIDRDRPGRGVAVTGPISESRIKAGRIAIIPKMDGGLGLAAIVIVLGEYGGQNEY
jgi:hypothetical protein